MRLVEVMSSHPDEVLRMMAAVMMRRVCADKDSWAGLGAAQEAAANQTLTAFSNEPSALVARRIAVRAV